MVQFNLLPDIKKQYIQAKRTKRLIFTSSTVVAVASISLVVALFIIVQVAQKNHISELTDDINSKIASLQSIPDLDKILTIQNQLNSLPQLHEGKPSTSRLFNYLFQLTPEDIKIQEVDLDFESTTIKISGSADSLATVNQYVDTIKFATYKTAEITDGKPFDQVISELSRSDQSASYVITMIFDPIIFDNTQEVALVVPSQITTRSTVGKPNLEDSDNSLFEDNSNQGATQ